MRVSAASRLPSIVGLPSDQGMGAVGGDEVDDRSFVLEVAGKIDPALIRLEQHILVGRRVELAPGFVQRGNAGIATAREIDGREVERQAQKVVAQRARDELVDLVAHLARHAANDGAGRDVGVDGLTCAVGFELERVKEAFDQADVIFVECRIEAVDRLGQHRMAEAIDDMRKLGDDRRIDGDVIAVGNQKHVDVGLDLAGEFLEHEMLILHLGAELRRLEQAFTVPDETSLGGRHCRNVGREPLVQECHGLRLRGAVSKHGLSIGQDHRLRVLDEPVMLGMEHMVDGGQADILVGAAVAGDEVRVQELVVVCPVFGRSVFRIAESDLDIAIGESGRDSVVGDVCEKGVAG